MMDNPPAGGLDGFSKVRQHHRARETLHNSSVAARQATMRGLLLSTCCPSGVRLRLVIVGNMKKSASVGRSLTRNFRPGSRSFSRTSRPIAILGSAAATTFSSGAMPRNGIDQPLMAEMIGNCRDSNSCSTS